MMAIDKESKLPLYYQLMKIIIYEIEHNMQVDEKLPSERDFCNKYNLSRSTVRQAFLELEQNNYIYRIHGKGTFVSPKKLNQELLKFYSFTTEMKKVGKVPTTQVLSFECVECNEKLAKKMKLEEGTKLYSFMRLRLADNNPVMLEISYIPQSRFKGLTRKALEENAMYDLFTQVYGVEFTFAEERFQAVITDECTARYLKISKSIPSLMIERFTYERDNIIEYTCSMARGDQMEYSIRLNK